MKILGINAFGQNPSAALVIDGELTGFSHEERFNRLKNSHNLFPSYTITWLLNSNNLLLEDVDYIAFNWDCTKYPWKRAKQLLSTKINLSGTKNNYGKSDNSSNVYSALEYLLNYTPGNVINKIKRELRRSGHKGKIPKIEFVDHHLSHAFQAYYHSPFSDCLVLVADGHGEENCVSGYFVEDGSFKKITNYKVPYSLGWFYGGMSAYLGFYPDRDEGKLMGLAAYGKKRAAENPYLEVIDEMIKISDKEFELNPFFFKIGAKDYNYSYTNSLVKFLTAIDPELQPISVNEKVIKDGNVINKYLQEKYIDLAFAVQSKLEGALNAVISQMVDSAPFRNLAYAGGVAMNCKANRVIADHPGIDRLFVHPASSDDGSAIGAAFYIAKHFDSLRHVPLTHTQYGAGFNNDEIQKILDNCGVNYQKTNYISTDAAKLLTEGKIIGWFQGNAEMGARALGGRSILANPFESEIKNKINSNVKYREIWRPYCPSILKGNSKRYLNDSEDARFMIVADEATKEFADTAPAVVHVDNTVRPQLVDKEVLPEYGNLIEDFGHLTGHPVVLNTSFNVRGEPITNNPYDAIRTFYSTGLDALAIGDFIVKKR
ncbi:MAG: carbamoyltransferase [Melioribacteraceae bacterium]|nr:MAG: carbamoyltransferase [Melioribacteraceae bacterium]